ncbi:uncharacterized protein BXZ73DRAFT_20922, partial [Epithele typhae]|uniref:uncharacterized protein n=1 Tax=Epithele typhae TaxID=378194 RepID=UPI0020071E9A
LELKLALELHSQGVGMYVQAQDIVSFMAFPGNLVRFGLTKLVSHTTAKRWMHKLGRFWKHEPTGQYVDGHEREDVVNYRQKKFLP